MKQFNTIIDKDPLKLKKYDTGSAERPSKMIYIFLIAVPVLLALSLVFWVLGSLASAFDGGYTPSSERSRASPQTDPESEDYDPDALPVRGDIFTDRSKIADTLAKV